MKKEVIGHIACNICGHADAEVKEDKNANAFVFCTDCAAQTFTRNAFRDGKLRSRMRPVTVTVTEQKLPEPTAPTGLTEKRPVAASKPVAVPAPQKTQVAPPALPDPASKPKKASWFQPILSGGQ